MDKLRGKVKSDKERYCRRKVNVAWTEQKWKLVSIFYLMIKNDRLDKIFPQEQTGAWAATKVSMHSFISVWGKLKQPAILH